MCVFSDGSTSTQHDRWDQNQAPAGQSSWTGRTVFQVTAPPSPTSEHGMALSQWSKRQWRQLRASTKAVEQPAAPPAPDRFRIIELFTPPRIAKLAVTRGFNCLTADQATGWDFRRPADRQRLLDTVREHRPELMYIGPPCTWVGGWFELDSPHLDVEQRAEKTRLIRLFSGFIADFAQMQLANGGHLVFEPPARTDLWKLPKLTAVTDRMYKISVDMCAYGLVLPDGCPVQKRVSLLVSHAHMRSLSRPCPVILCTSSRVVYILGLVQWIGLLLNIPLGSLERFFGW